jgi:hypothetical protein
MSQSTAQGQRALSLLVNRLRGLMRTLPGGDAADADFEQWGREFIGTVVRVGASSIILLLIVF